MDWHSWNGKQNRKSTGHFFLLHFILLLVPSSWQKLTGSQLIKEKRSLPTPISKTKAEYINRRVSLNPRCLLGSLITGTCYLTHPVSLQFQELLLTLEHIFGSFQICTVFWWILLLSYVFYFILNILYASIISSSWVSKFNFVFYYFCWHSE